MVTDSLIGLEQNQDEEQVDEQRQDEEQVDEQRQDEKQVDEYDLLYFRELKSYSVI